MSPCCKTLGWNNSSLKSKPEVKYGKSIKQQIKTYNPKQLTPVRSDHIHVSFCWLSYHQVTWLHTIMVNKQCFLFICIGLGKKYSNLALCYSCIITAREKVPLKLAYVAKGFLVCTKTPPYLSDSFKRAPFQLLWRAWPQSSRARVRLSESRVCSFWIKKQTRSQTETFWVWAHCQKC